MSTGIAQQTLIRRLTLFVVSMRAIAPYLWILYFSRYGFDVTDEGFYLSSARNAFDYSLNIPPTLFGFVYYWPYQISGGDIAALRVTNVLVTGGLSWLLSFLVLQRFSAPVMRRSTLVVSAGAVSTLSLVDFSLWLLTPDYSSLALHALMLVMTGLLLVDRPTAPVWSWGWALIAIGGCLCFLAKPTTAAGAALLVGLYALVFLRHRLLPMLTTALGAVILLALVALAIDGSIGAFNQRLSGSAEITVLAGSGQDFSRIFRLDSLDFGRSQLVSAALAVLATSAFVLLLGFSERHGRAAVLVVAVLALAYGGFLIARSSVLVPVDRAGLVLLPFALLAGAALPGGREWIVDQSWRAWAMAAIFLFLPHVYFFGSNGNYWTNGSNATLFWMLSPLVLFSPLGHRGQGAALLAASLLAPIMALTMIHGAIQAPYRQQPDLRDNTAVTAFPGQGGLILSQPLHDYLVAVVEGARSAGFEPGSPAIDLTGRSPGILYVMEARSLGFPWLPGGYPGSAALAQEALAGQSCEELAVAWLLVELGGPDILAEDEVLASFGAGLNDDYAVAAAFATAPQSGGHEQSHPQTLLRPTRPPAAAVAACELARRDLPVAQDEARQ